MALAGWARVLDAQTSWETVAAPIAANLWSVAAGNGTFVAVGEQGTILTSSDGRAWVARDSGSEAWLVGVAFGDGLFVAVGDRGTVLTSTDAMTWTSRPSGTLQRLNGVARGVDRWLAVGEAGTVVTSSDGLHWDSVPVRPGWTDVPPGWLHGLWFAYGQFVATGERGAILTAADTNQFQTRSVPTNANLEGVTYGLHQFVAVVDDGLVLTSPDAVQWRGHQGPKPLRAITVFNEQYVAAAIDGSIATSPDAIAWTVRETGNSRLLTALAADTGVVVAVGFSGAILRSVAELRAPTLVAAPADRLETAGSTVALRVRADGGGPFTYQWSRDGVRLADATSDTLVLPGVTEADAGTYRVTVSNGAGSVTSAGTRIEITNALEPSSVRDVTFKPPGCRSNALSAGGNGRMLIGGCGEVRRLLADGSDDPTFTTTEGPFRIEVLVRQADGKILVGGASATGSAELIRLLADGGRDPAFSAPALPGEAVTGVAIQADDKILVATNTAQLVRLLADGSVDWNFTRVELTPYVTPGEGTPRIRSVAVAPDQRIVVAAETAEPMTVPPGDKNVWVARLLSSGAIDPSFTPTQTSRGTVVRLLEVLADQRILLVTEVPTTGFYGGWWRLERFNVDGTPDLTFVAQERNFGKYGGDVRAARDAAGRITLVTTANANVGAVWRFGPDGDLDPTLRGPTGLNYRVVAAAVDDTGRVWVSTTGELFRLATQNAAPAQLPIALEEKPEPIDVEGGLPLEIRAAAAGTGPLRYDWRVSFEDGTWASSSAQNPVLTLSAVYMNATVHLQITNAAGSVTFPPRRIHVRPRAPTLLVAPTDRAVGAGRIAELSFTARGSGPLTYEWWFNGALYSSGTLRPSTGPADGTGSDGTLSFIVDATRVGTYRLVLRNALGTVQSEAFTVTLDPEARLANVSSRGFVRPGEAALIAGFVISGDAPKWVMLRGVGPALRRYGIVDALADPQLTLYNAAGEVIAANDNWETSAVALSPFGNAAAAPLDVGSNDAVIVQRLAPGVYTARVSGADGATGVALAEVYEGPHDAPRLINLSSRVWVGAGEQTGIAGFVLTGTRPRTLLVRAVGPTLGAFGVDDALANPTLTLVDRAGTSIARNDDWGATDETETRRAIAVAATAVGTFPLPENSHDGAVLVTLEPGLYSALVNGADGGTGVALIEIYEVP